MAVKHLRGVFDATSLEDFEHILPTTLRYLDSEQILSCLVHFIQSRACRIHHVNLHNLDKAKKRVKGYVDNPASALHIIHELSTLSIEILDNMGMSEFNTVNVELFHRGNMSFIKFNVYEFDNCLRLEEFRLYLKYLEETESENISREVYQLIDRFIADSGLPFEHHLT